MKLALSTDYASPHHWQRLVAFASEHDVDHLVYWGDADLPTSAASSQGMVGWRLVHPFLYPRHPSWLGEQERAQATTAREKMSTAAQLTKRGGMQFWCCLQVLTIPDAERIRNLTPALFNEHGEPAMAEQLVYTLLEEQIDELLEIAPNLAGLEVHLCECADIVLSKLNHQPISFGETCGRIINTVRCQCQKHGLKLSVGLHTAAGHRSLLEGLLGAARAHPDIIVSADNTIGDFHLLLPFNNHLWRAAVTNPVQAFFDLHGEYWGRNFFPTCALSQYREFIDEARALGADCINGRISIGHDKWSPYFNVLPARRRFYPSAEGLKPQDPLPTDIEVCCFDSLGGFNAEFFCRYARDPSVTPEQVVGEFLNSELGNGLDELTRVLIDVDAVAARVFYADTNYFNAQSVLPSRQRAHFRALDVHLTTPRGEPFPPYDLENRGTHDGRAQFDGWPVPKGHRAAGVHAMVEEKRQAVADAENLLDRAGRATSDADPSIRTFILRQFEDFVLYARAASVLLEAMAHHFHLHYGKCCGDIPNRQRLAALLGEMETLADQWRQHQPNDEWKLASRLDEWQEEMATCC